MEIREGVQARVKRIKLLAEQVENERMPYTMKEHLYGVAKGIVAREEHRDQPLDAYARLAEYRSFHPAISEARTNGFLAVFEEVWCSECGMPVTGDAHYTEPRLLCFSCVHDNPTLLQE